MRVQPGQDRTPKFAGRVLPDRTSTGPILLSKFVHMYGLSTQIGKKAQYHMFNNIYDHSINSSMKISEESLRLC